MWLTVDRNGRILQLTDPDSFASLVLLNSKWRRVSQQAQLYAHHLSSCDSYAASHNAQSLAVTNESLPKLRRLFAREVKRNLFEAYLRPRKTTIKLISNSISSSSAPGGEGLQFSPSPMGHHLLAYNSSRIYILDVRQPEMVVKRELKILRRPASTCVLDDGSLLAVLSTDMQIDLYDLSRSPPRRKQCLILDIAPRAIALSPCGSVLAAAYESGIEVSSITPGALPTDRRSVKCDGVDSLAFSFDGTQLLGTTTNSQPSNTVILTAPYYDPGNHAAGDNISPMWTTSILFPNSSRDCSHAVLLQESSSVEAAWTFTYDRSFETFRAVRIDDLRNGTTYFTGPIPAADSPGPLVPCTLPAASYCGDLVSAGFDGRDIWLYGIPEDLEAIPENNSTTTDATTQQQGLHRRNSGTSVRSPSRALDNENGRIPQWQLLCDKYRNTFVGGCKVAELDNVSTVKWVLEFGEYSSQERLIIAARGVLPPKPITEEDGIDFVDGGRITILDFDYGVQDGGHKDITIEVGTQEPEVLEEESRDLDTEVAIVRRRTVARNRKSGVLRSATTATHHLDQLLPPPPVPSLPASEDPLVPRPMPTARNGSQPQAQQDEIEVSLEEAQEALDAPYAHANPRSGTTLRRAATAAAVNRQRNPEPPVAGPVQYRRADGRREHPHESDADNWVPPPPPYKKEVDPSDLPAFLRHTAISGAPIGQAIGEPPQPPAQPPPPPFTSNRPELPRLQTSPSRGLRNHTSWQPHGPHVRIASDSTSMTRPSTHRMSVERPMTSPSMHNNRQDEEEDIYDATPPRSPRATRPQQSMRTPERPSPQQRSAEGTSAGAVSSVTYSTPASSGSYPTNGRFDEDSVEDPVYANALASSLPPQEEVDDLQQSGNQIKTSPSIRRLSISQTWPRVPPGSQVASGSASVADEYPRSAPPTTAKIDELVATALPPLPSPDQGSRLGSRQEIAPPPRGSGLFKAPRVRTSGGFAPHQEERASFRHSVAVPGLGSASPSEEPDVPLIISTPKGVSGAFDVPEQQQSSGSYYQRDLAAHSAGPVLHAPVPRHPRPATTSAILRPEDGEMLASTPSQPLTAAALRHHTSLSRRQSRARRSAAKNILDAKTRGWTGRKKKQQQQQQQGQLGLQQLDGGGGAEGEAGWTDVSLPAGPGTSSGKKKCVVM